ncbi:MAG: hypothetical protein H7123_07220 [Thermoleophilia bacterium]|nr:hypothetical protein [Thermoleophilia bacterium]
MTTTRSMFTEAIEDHLALKKQNSTLSSVMPLEAYDVGDPLDRYPGGPVSPAADAQALPTVDQAMAAADESLNGHVVEGAFRPPLQPLSGMTPMLSLVEDVEDEFSIDGGPTLVNAAHSAALLGSQGSVVRFPGGVGPRPALTDDADTDVADNTGDYPVIVIDADEPLSNAPSGDVVLEPRPFGSDRIKRPSFFGGLRAKRKQRGSKDDSWFTGSPRDFNWEE